MTEANALPIGLTVLTCIIVAVTAISLLIKTAASNDPYAIVSVCWLFIIGSIMSAYGGVYLTIFMSPTQLKYAPPEPNVFFLPSPFPYLIGAAGLALLVITFIIFVSKDDSRRR